jgi:NAD(P)-dependent dehydrogenase (short-subunit alcohol dehydrogenase family)
MEQLIQGGSDSGARRVPRLDGRCALVIGASRGIGEATAVAFVEHGARVVLASRSLGRMEETAARLRAAGGDVRVFRVDVTDAATIAGAVEHCVKEFGGLDVAVNNAAANNVRMPLHEITEDMFDGVMDTNLRGTFVAMKHEIRAMLAAGGGSIVNTASAASLVAFPGMAAYVASKHAIAGITKAAALEYAAQRIRVNAVAPGAVLTDMLREGSASTPEGKARVEAATPMHRIAAPEEIAAAIVWLASDDSSFVTGVTLPVDGGYILP